MNDGPLTRKETLSRVVIALLFVLTNSESGSAQPRLLIAYTSFREKPLHPTIFLYEHDGQANGKITGKISPVENRSDHHPSLSPDGKLCVFAAEIVSTVSTIQGWNLDKREPQLLTAVNKSPNAQMAPSLDAAGIVGFEAWNRPGSPGRWDVLLFHVNGETAVESPDLNTSEFDERKPALSGDGRWLACTTNAQSGDRLSEIFLYDREAAQRVALPNLNSPFMDTEPTVNRDGTFIAFVSDRPGGKGARDIMLYDRQESRLVPLPGLNSVGQEQSPSISPDGRYISFVSERIDGTGERDIYLYDRQTKSLLPLPGLNSVRDEYDPCVINLES